MPSLHMITLLGALAFLKTAMITILAFALVFGLLAFCHEFGHMLTAKMLGMSVDQFGIGFPPNYGWTLFRRSGTSYTLHPVPLGAFVKIQGMDPGDPDTPNSFMRQPPWARIIVLMGGSAANMLLAVLVFALMSVTTGLPAGDHITNVVDSVDAKSPAYDAGIKPEDRLLGVRPASGVKTSSAKNAGGWVRPQGSGDAVDATAMIAAIHSNWTWQTVKGKREAVGLPLQVEVQHHADNRVEVLTITPAVHFQPKHEHFAAIGYTPQTIIEYRTVPRKEAGAAGLDQALAHAFDLVIELGGRFRQWIQQEKSASELAQGFGGPVMIARASGRLAQQGLPRFLMFVGALSIQLAVLNLLPLPVFDGGNIVLTLLEVVRRKQLEPHLMMAVQLAGVALILCLFGYITFNDIFNPNHGMP